MKNYTKKSDHKNEKRVHRLLWLIQEIRNDPRQELKALLARAGISRAQFYKDRDVLGSMGFVFDYKTKEGFLIREDRLSASIDLTLSDRILLMFALRHLYTCGDGHLVARALTVAKKLAGGLEEPFRGQVTAEFDQVVIREGYGCDPKVIEALEKAIQERRRLKIFYESRRSDKTEWREIDPLRIYFLQRTLYLYGKLIGGNPPYRTFRISRIKEVHPTGMCLAPQTVDDGFYRELGNAFQYFMGPEAHEVVIRFKGRAVEYISETLWHPTQEIIPDGKDGILFKVKVAEPKEVIWWARQFGEDVECS